MNPTLVRATRRVATFAALLAMVCSLALLLDPAELEFDFLLRTVFGCIIVWTGSMMVLMAQCGGRPRGVRTGRRPS